MTAALYRGDQVPQHERETSTTALHERGTATNTAHENANVGRQVDDTATEDHPAREARAQADDDVDEWAWP